MLSVLVASISTLIFGMALGFTSPAIDVMQDTLEVNGKATSVPADLVPETHSWNASDALMLGKVMVGGELIVDSR